MEIKLFTVFLLFFALSGNAQERGDFGLYTDRDVYTSGETLLLKAFAPLNEQTGIVNIDLINSKGKTITWITLEIIDHQANGYVYLPDSLSSGTYILRTATRSSGTQTIKELYVVNRFTGLTELNTILRPSGVIPVKALQIQTVQINGLKNLYKSRENGVASVHFPDDLLGQIEGKVHVSISKVTSEFNAGTFILNTKSAPGPIIEKGGIILEGVVTDIKTAKTFKNAVVTLSISDSLPVFKYYITGEDGRFYFQLKNYYGKIPVVIQCYDRLKNQPLKIDLSDTERVRSGFPSFETLPCSGDMQKIFAQNIEAATIRKIFNQQEIKVLPVPPQKVDAFPFYGIPGDIVYPRLFIDLPDFNEISRELLPGVKFRTYNRIPTIQVLSASRHNYFNESPLVLLDGIPIQDLNIIKNLGSNKIDRVEICPAERYFGDLSFAGVVAIYTTKANDSIIPESDDLVKFNLEAIQPQSILNTPSDQSSTEPDLRQVLVWSPSINPGKTISVEFQTSDIKGNYKLVIRGKTKDGTFFYNEQNIEVN